MLLHSKNALQGLLCLLPVLIHADTYWVDSSCGQYEQPGRSFKASIKEAINFASIANERLGNAQDTDARRLFVTMFQTNQGNPDEGNVGKVRSIFSSIASLTETSQRLGSKIRIYCDNDSPPRWREISPNGANGGDRPNQWTETINHMRKSREPSCLRNPSSIPPAGNLVPWIKGHTISDVNTSPSLANGEAADPETKRSVISICKLLLDHPSLKFTSPDPSTQDFTSAEDKSVENLYVLSQTILHEFTHCEPHRLKDENKPSSYGWKNIIGFSSYQALTNADTYAMFGRVSFLKGFKINDVKDDQRVAGKIVRSTMNLARRLLRRMRRTGFAMS